MKKKIHSLENSKNDQTFNHSKKQKVNAKKVKYVNSKTLKNSRDLIQKRHTKKEKKKEQESQLTFKEKIFTKKNIIYFVILLVDLIFIYYVARKNVVNYAVVNGKNILIGDGKKLLFGRNYISIAVTVFFYGYYCLINHFLLHEKITKKFLIGLFFVLVCVNFLFFFLFTTRVY